MHYGNTDTEKQIIIVLSEIGAATRPQLVHRTGIARSTLYDTLMRLMMQGVVDSYRELRPKRGRPQVFYRLAHKH